MKRLDLYNSQNNKGNKCMTALELKMLDSFIASQKSDVNVFVTEAVWGT